MQQQLVTSSLSDVETDSQSDVVDRVVGSSLSGLNDESSPDSDVYTRTLTGNITSAKIWTTAG